MAKQDQRREQTRAQLLETARRLFLSRGYAATTTQLILKETGLSKGALYHHFDSKSDMFEALYEDASKTAIQRALAAIDMSCSPYERLKTSTLAWLSEIRDPNVAKIMLELGPEALGWARAKAIEDAYSLPMMKAGLEAVQASGEINVASIEMTARFMNAVLAEAAFSYVEKGETAWPEIKASLDELFERLKA